MQFCNNVSSFELVSLIAIVLYSIVCDARTIKRSPPTVHKSETTTKGESQQPIRVEAENNNIFGKIEATNYLIEYGWLDRAQGREGDSEMENLVADSKPFTESLKAFQLFAKLPQTGLLDEETILVMQQPRCGVKDKAKDDSGGGILNQLGDPYVKSETRSRRYANEGSYWGDTKITYSIDKYTNNMDQEKVDEVFKDAFKVWELASKLKFAKVEEGEDATHISIKFVRRQHGDGEPFDGRGQILAHAFFPRYGGSVHFDEDEPWTSPGSRGIDLYSVATHEIGHALGLQHSDNNNAIMAPFYPGYTGKDMRAHKDDRSALTKLYGYSDQKCNCRAKTTWCKGPNTKGTLKKCGCGPKKSKPGSTTPKPKTARWPKKKDLKKSFCADTFSDDELAQLDDVRFVNEFHQHNVGGGNPEILSDPYTTTTSFTPREMWPARLEGTFSESSSESRDRSSESSSENDSNHLDIPFTESVGNWGYSQVKVRNVG